MEAASTEEESLSIWRTRPFHFIDTTNPSSAWVPSNLRERHRSRCSGRNAYFLLESRSSSKISFLFFWDAPAFHDSNILYVGRFIEETYSVHSLDALWSVKSHVHVSFSIATLPELFGSFTIAPFRSIPTLASLVRLGYIQFFTSQIFRQRNLQLLARFVGSSHSWRTSCLWNLLFRRFLFLLLPCFLKLSVPKLIGSRYGSPSPLLEESMFREQAMIHTNRLSCYSVLPICNHL